MATPVPINCAPLECTKQSSTMFVDVINSVSRVLAFPAVERSALTSIPWGEGLIELSLSTLWRARSWSDLSDDEFALFIPNLVHDGHPEFSPAARFRSATLGRLRTSLLVLGGDPQQTFRYITETSALSGIYQDDELQAVISREATREECALARRLKSSSSTDWRAETAILSSLSRLLRKEEAASPPLTDALIASIHTAFNAAYICPSHTYAHELLGAGAWLGILLRGRSALMPEFVAHVFLDGLDPSRRNDLVPQILHHHAERTGGAPHLLQQAKRVLKSGRPVVIRHGRPIFATPSPAHET
jgi:hypothetical protein